MSDFTRNGETRFQEGGKTKNGEIVVNSIPAHGRLVFHASEFHLKPFICKGSACNLADVIAVYKNGHRFYLIGIEIKDWIREVYSGLAKRYLDAYRKSCEFFYIAARSFSQELFHIEDIGLFDLNALKVIKSPRYLYPDYKYRSHVIWRIKREFNELLDVVEDPYQRTLCEF
ncbi:MAG: hypothetical protein KKI07_02750 [Euryarchaeota archaeon]|nr:hypothetical protein [Euryarchaeota archaeon]